MPIPLRPIDAWTPATRRNVPFEHAAAANRTHARMRRASVRVPAGLAIGAVRAEAPRDRTADVAPRGENDGWPCLPLARTRQG